MLEFANANVFLSLTNTPDELNVLLDGMFPRFVIQFANANRYLEFAYPRDLIGDTTPTQISDINTSQAGDTSTLISWKTNEFSDSAVECGTNSGVYTMTVSDSMFVLQHSMLVSGLAPDVEYFCRVSSQDLSGNLGISNEFSFVQAKTSYIFLPLIVK
ncbi:MAG: fibronectin type III domain-containing protein [Anaerolineaceae bacterium]|nr:fibronectin type III domain-containing protein [Anaerolineaceae bacterium]